MSSFDDKVKGNWNIIKGELKQKWADLTDDDLLYTEGKKDEFLGNLQKKTGETKDKIEKFINKVSEK